MRGITAIDKDGNKTELFKNDYDSQEHVKGKKPKTVNNFRLCKLNGATMAKRVLRSLLKKEAM